MRTNKKDTMTTQEDIFRSNKNILSEHYDIGELAHQERIYKGYINDSFKIAMLRDDTKSRYLLRRYRKGTCEEKIKFEHALLHELKLRGFEFSPRLVPTKDGKTYVGIARHPKNRAQKIYTAVFSFLPGEDKCTWDHTLRFDEELINSAQIFAMYHSTIFGWQGTEDWRERSAFDEIDLMSSKWQRYAQNAAQSPFDHFYLEQFGDLLSMLKNIPPRKKYNAMQQLAVHGDYHPGNLKFREGKVTGVLDFGWSKIDARCLDVGLGILYFCAAWEGPNDGNLLLDRVNKFLGAYQKVAGDINTVGPLNQLELKYLPQMIHMGNLIVIDWIINQFYNTDPDSRKYLRYFRHSIALNQWLKNNLNDLMDCIQQHSI